MDGRRPEHGRRTARAWTFAGRLMDASTHNASAIRKRHRSKCPEATLIARRKRSTRGYRKGLL
jgi:hypothetical protein